MAEHQDTILEQIRGVYTIAITTELGPAVPYEPVNHGDGTLNHGFVDLTVHPEMLSEVPELKDRPGFATLVKIINDPQSPLMTLGCEAALFKTQDAGEATHYVGGYIDIAYRDAALATQDNLIGLARYIVKVRKPKQDDWTIYEFNIQRLRHFFGKEAFNLELKVLGYGRNELEAWEMFNFRCTEMADLFRNLT
jgi:hypothetical protein